MGFDPLRKRTRAHAPVLLVTFVVNSKGNPMNRGKAPIARFATKDCGRVQIPDFYHHQTNLP
jgi:hypothetical protein